MGDEQAATVEGATAPPPPEAPAPKVRALRAGTGARRVKTRNIGLYGPGKVGKTTACGSLKGAYWVVSDPNTIPTLMATGALPPEADLFEVGDYREAIGVLAEMIEVAANAAANGQWFGTDTVIFDSLTCTWDSVKEIVAAQTQQAFLGQRKKDNGWQEANAEMGSVLRMCAELAKYVNVVGIFHSKDKFDIKKGELHGLNLGPELAQLAARLVNWLLYLSIETDTVEEGTTPDECSTIIQSGDGTWQRVRRVFHTRPYQQYPASVNARFLAPEEPPDLYKLLLKEKLIKRRKELTPVK